MWQTVCFVGTLEADMATKIIIIFFIDIRKLPPQIYHYQRNKKKEKKLLKTKK